MKNLILLILLFLSGVTYGQNENTFFKALKNKDTNTISNFLTSDVDLCIGAYQDFITRDEAIVKIMDFLNKEDPSSFEMLHNGKSEKSGSNYNVAKLKCNSGSFRVFIYYENHGDSYKISELRFDR